MTTTMMLPEALLRHSIGLDTFNRFVETPAVGGNYPPHNIEQVGPDRYRLTLAVAGFTPDMIEIETHEGNLVIRSVTTPEQPQDARNFVHRGIAFRPFTRVFRLDRYVEVVSAALDHGLLEIELERQLPEALKPRRIALAA